MTEYHSEDPTVEGWYRVWELCSGLSLEAYWDIDLQKWIFPSDWEEDPHYGNVIDKWCELETN